MDLPSGSIDTDFMKVDEYPSVRQQAEAANNSAFRKFL
jgi:hypothetical protein